MWDKQAAINRLLRSLRMKTFNRIFDKPSNEIPLNHALGNGQWHLLHFLNITFLNQSYRRNTLVVTAKKFGMNGSNPHKSPFVLISATKESTVLMNEPCTGSPIAIKAANGKRKVTRNMTINGTASWRRTSRQ